MRSIRMSRFLCVATILVATAADAPAGRQPSPGDEHRAAWMQGQWGVMHHWLADWIHARHCLSPYGFRLLSAGAPSDVVHRLLAIRHLVPPKTSDEWNQLVDGFDAETLARQIHEAGAGWFMLTIGQNSGHYCSPNATYRRISAESVVSCWPIHPPQAVGATPAAKFQIPSG